MNEYKSDSIVDISRLLVKVRELTIVILDMGIAYPRTKLCHSIYEQSPQRESHQTHAASPTQPWDDPQVCWTSLV